MKRILLGIVCILIVVMFVACNKNTPNEPANEKRVVNIDGLDLNEVGKSINKVYIDSINIPLKENLNEADNRVKESVEMFENKLYDGYIENCYVYVLKLYKASDEQEVPALLEKNLGENDIAFEVSISIQPKGDVDYNQFMEEGSYYVAEDNLVSGISRVGILRYDEKNGISITDFGKSF